MAGNLWPALQSCKLQGYEENDVISQLPDDLLFFIMSFLTLKEAARTSVLSRRWNKLWRSYPFLIFEDCSTMKRLFNHDHADSVVQAERLRFLRWVSHVMNAHIGRYVDELRVAFDLNSRCQLDMDRWLAFAVAKQVKRLELDCTTRALGLWKARLPKWRLSLDQPNNLSVFKSGLHSLTLAFVNITSKDVCCLLRSCTVLENFCLKYSRSIKYIRAFDSPLQLKHFKVSHCRRLRTIDIWTPKLLSFTHYGNPIELNIRNAYLLSKLLLGYKSCVEDILTYAFDSLSKYFSQLEYLSWRMRLYFGGFRIGFPCTQQFNLGIKNVPVMTNLKHLELNVESLSDQTLLGWVDLIEAAPLLERLTLKFFTWEGRLHRQMTKRNVRPLKSLKTLELYNDLGLPIDLEIATYVIENSVNLENVIVELRPLLESLSQDVSLEDQVARVKSLVPQGVKLTLNVKLEHAEDENYV